MNRVRDQLLARAGFSLDKNSGTGRRYALNLFEHRFQRRAVAYDLLESALTRHWITSCEFCESSHRDLLALACAVP